MQTKADRDKWKPQVPTAWEFWRPVVCVVVIVLIALFCGTRPFGLQMTLIAFFLMVPTLLGYRYGLGRQWPLAVLGLILLWGFLGSLSTSRPPGDKFVQTVEHMFFFADGLFSLTAFGLMIRKIVFWQSPRLRQYLP